MGLLLVACGSRSSLGTDRRPEPAAMGGSESTLTGGTEVAGGAPNGGGGGTATGGAAGMGGPDDSRRVISVAAGTFRTCALIDDGSVRCWGSNEYGAAGYGRGVCPGVSLPFWDLRHHAASVTKTRKELRTERSLRVPRLHGFSRVLG